MYRSNRHARASHYMMGISACDNALWDLRARVLGVPVFRLLGGPTQQPVRVYGSCLGFSIEPALAGKRAAQLEKTASSTRNGSWDMAPATAAPGWT